jgi:sugar lactone lactonase YvrE
MPTHDLVVAAGPIAYHSEGPVWWPGWGGLRYVDMLAGDLLDLDLADGSVRRTAVGTIAAAVRPRAGGGSVVAVERGFVLLDEDDRLVPGSAVEAFDDPTVRMNEGGCDPDGHFVVGSMAYDGRPGAGALYRLTPEGRISVVLSGVTCSNGLAWSPDGTLAYYVDTPTQRIDVLDHAPGTGLTGRRPLVQVEDGVGVPDGLTVDAEGCLWVALHGGSAVRRYRPDGTLDGVVELPVSQVTACAFGGADLDQLFVTTSRENLPDGVEPESGSVYVTRPGVRGLPVLTFAG